MQINLHPIGLKSGLLHNLSAVRRPRSVITMDSRSERSRVPKYRLRLCVVTMSNSESCCQDMTRWPNHEVQELAPTYNVGIWRSIDDVGVWCHPQNIIPRKVHDRNKTSLFKRSEQGLHSRYLNSWLHFSEFELLTNYNGIYRFYVLFLILCCSWHKKTKL